MAKNTQLTNLVVNAQADALARLLDGGWCDIYDGAQPANGDAAVAGTKLAHIQFNATSAPAAVAGVLTFNAMAAAVALATSAGATWARCFKADGTTAVMDVSAGIATSNIILNSAAIQVGAQVAISSFTHTVAKATAGS